MACSPSDPCDRRRRPDRHRYGNRDRRQSGADRRHGRALRGNESTGILLSGTASSDPGNDTLSYAWDLDSNGSFETAGATPLFTATDEGTYTVGLQVTDSGGLSDTDTATVTVANVAPTANAGGPYAVDEGSAVTLDASGSTDPGSDTLSFAWDLDGDDRSRLAE